MHHVRMRSHLVIVGCYGGTSGFAVSAFLNAHACMLGCFEEFKTNSLSVFLRVISLSVFFCILFCLFSTVVVCLVVLGNSVCAVCTLRTDVLCPRPRGCRH